MPVLTDLPPAPDELKIVRCNYHTPFQHHIMDYSFQDFCQAFIYENQMFLIVG